MPRVRAAAFVAPVLLASVVAGCTGDDRPATAPTTTSAGAVGDVAAEDQPDRSRFDFGDTVRIEDDRVVPLRLGATVDGDVVFLNSTDREVSIRFSGSLDDSERLESGPIPPGGSFRVRALYIGQFTYVVGPGPDRTGAIEVHTVEGLKSEPGK